MSLHSLVHHDGRSTQIGTKPSHSLWDAEKMQIELSFPSKKNSNRDQASLIRTIQEREWSPTPAHVARSSKLATRNTEFLTAVCYHTRALNLNL